MSKTVDHFAYRCLPLTIANSYGWEMLVDQPFTATWNGEPTASDIQVSFLGENPSPLPCSHFGYGVLTFSVSYLFKTEARQNLWITGPINHPKDGIIPLSGVVETDWAPYTFTMNWLFTRPGSVTFQKDEPFCHFFQIEPGILQEIDPEVRNIDEDPVNLKLFQEWSSSRARFRKRLKDEDEEALKQGWQKHYFRGLAPDGTRMAEAHQSKLVVNPFVDCRVRKDGTVSPVAPPSKPYSAKKDTDEEPSVLFQPLPRAGFSDEVLRSRARVKVIQACFQTPGAETTMIAFPDPVLTANVYCAGRLDELIREAAAPFWSSFQEEEDPEGLCYLWFHRYNRCGEHLKIRLHGPERNRERMRRRLAEAIEPYLTRLPVQEPSNAKKRRDAPPIDVEDFAETDYPDRTLLWTEYGRSHLLLGGKPFLIDDRYAALITSCFGATSELALEALMRNGSGEVPHHLRQNAFLKALVEGFSILDFPAEKRKAYLTYHRDTLLRFELADVSWPRQKASELLARFNQRADESRSSLDLLRRAIDEVWNDGGTNANAGPHHKWRQSVGILLEYITPFCSDPDYQLDPFAADPLFPPLFKVFHVAANQLGFMRINEALACHLLWRAASGRVEEAQQLEFVPQ